MTRVSESKRDGRSFLKLSLVFVLAVVLSLSIIPLGDNGSSDAAAGHRAPNADEIAIHTYEDLILIDDSSVGMGEKYILMADIDMSSKVFVPLGANGSSPVQFTGSFDGNGYVISNMTIVGTDVSNYRYAGLFAQLGSGSSVSNLGIVDSEINVTFTSGGTVYAGGIAGELWVGTITDCYNTGSVSSSSFEAFAGGIAGESNGTITDCYNTGSVSSSSSSNNAYAGGIAGRLWEGTITDCYNTGSVSSSSSSSFEAFAGGIAGKSEKGIITDCYNTGSVSSSISSSSFEAFAGGIAGRLWEGTITDCYNTGSVSSSSSSSSSVFAGGIAGKSEKGTIADCYNTGSVSSSSSISSVFAGGIAGEFNDGTMSCCYNTGSVTGETTGTLYISGIAFGGGTITDSFYLDTCGAAPDGNQRTAAQLRDPATYTAVLWDFSAVWTFTNAGAVNSGLPILKNTGYLDIFITEDPKDVTIPAPANHGYIYFSTGAVSGEPMSYEWEYFNAASGIDWEPLPYGGGMNMETVSIHSNDYADGDMFRCKISNGGNTVYTEPAVLYIGTGTSPTVHNVTSEADLNAVGRGTYGSEVWGPADTYIQITDITLTGLSTNFTPIPDFSGIYDGAGYTITNMNITITGGNIGMFSRIEADGIVRNVGLVAGAVISSPTTGAVCVGGLVGISDGMIVNCYNTGTVMIESTTSPVVIPSRVDVGGLVGWSTGEIKDCYNTGDVTTQLLRETHAGGIVGSIFSSLIMNCYNTGAVTAVSNSQMEAGGIAGYIAHSFVMNSYNTGDISGKAPSANAVAYAGGISGESLTSSISDCYNTGDIEAEGDRFAMAGGVVGRYATVSNCYNTGNVTVTSLTTSTYANVRAGGIIGYSGTETYGCYSIGTIAASVGGAPAEAHVGGISTGDVTTIIDCYYVAAAELSGEGGTWIDISDIDVMKFESTFEGWDFNNTWILLLVDGHVMPHLRAIMPEIYIHPANESRLSGDNVMRVTVNKQLFSEGVYDWEYETSTPGVWLTAPAAARIAGDPFAINASPGTNYRFVAQYTAYKGAAEEVSGWVTSVEGCITTETFYDVSSTIELRTGTSAPAGSPNGRGYVIVGNAMTPVGTDTVLTFFPEAGFAITDVKCDGTSVFSSMVGNTYTVPSAASGTTVVIVAEVSPLMEMTVAAEGLSSINDAVITYLVNGKSETPVNGKLMVPANVDISATVDATDPSSHLFQMWISTDLGKGSLGRTFTFTTPVVPASFTITSVFVSDDADKMSITNGGVPGGEVSIEVGSILLDTVFFGNTAVVPLGSAYTFKFTALDAAAKFQRWSSPNYADNLFDTSISRQTSSDSGLTYSMMAIFVPSGSPVLPVTYNGEPGGSVTFAFFSDVMNYTLTTGTVNIQMGGVDLTLSALSTGAVFQTWVTSTFTQIRDELTVPGAVNTFNAVTANFISSADSVLLSVDYAYEVGGDNGEIGFVLNGVSVIDIVDASTMLFVPMLSTDTLIAEQTAASLTLADFQRWTSSYSDYNTFAGQLTITGLTSFTSVTGHFLPFNSVKLTVEYAGEPSGSVTFLVDGDNMADKLATGSITFPIGVAPILLSGIDGVTAAFQWWTSDPVGYAQLKNVFAVPAFTVDTKITANFVPLSGVNWVDVGYAGETGGDQGEIGFTFNGVVTVDVEDAFSTGVLIPMLPLDTLVLTPAGVSDFQRWSSDIPGYNTFANPLSITGLTGPTSITGCFIPNGSPVLTVVYSGTPTGTVNFSFGADVMIEVLTEIYNVYNIPLGDNPVLLTPAWGVDAAFDTWSSTDITVSGWDPLPLNSGDILPLTAATVTAEFVPNEYTITATAGSGGSITPLGNITVAFRADQTFTIAADRGYLTRVLVDGVEVNVINTYVFNAVRDNHTIDVTFVLRQYVVKISSDAGSTASPEGTVTVPYGVPLKIAIGALSGYRISDVLLDGSSISYSADSVTLSNIRSNCTVNVVSTYVGTIKLEITNIPDGGKAEYNVNGGDFQGYTGPVNIEKGSDVIIRITPPAGEKWRDSTDPTMVFFGNVQSDILFDVLKEDTGGDGDDKDNTMTYLIIILIIIIIAILIAIMVYRSRRST